MAEIAGVAVRKLVSERLSLTKRRSPNISIPQQRRTGPRDFGGGVVGGWVGGWGHGGR